MGWAVGYAARSYYNSAPQGGQRLTADRIPSPAYIYDSIRSPGYACDRGTKISDALELLKQGALAHAEYPYDQNLCRRPGTDVAARASRFRIADWRVVDTDRLDQVKAELANGHPLVIGMRPNREFHRLRGERIWRAGVPEEDDGHHAVTVVGYSERGQYFTVMNSWGPGWGEGGFGRISYDTFARRVKYGFSMFPNPGHHHVVGAQLPRQLATTPVRRSVRWSAPGPVQNPSLQPGGALVNRSTAMSGIQAGQSLLLEPGLPSAHIPGIAAHGALDPQIRLPGIEHQNDLGSSDVFGPQHARTGSPLQFFSFIGSQLNGGVWHA